VGHITSSISSLPEIAGNAALLVNPLKADEIASAISSLSTNEDLRRKKIEAGFANIKRFSWKRSAESVLSIYEAVYASAEATKKHPGFSHKHVLATRE
jgi:glycosyltransferase involved in cell wall biosynthesis